MSSREEVAKVIDLYIEGLNSENVDMIPLTRDVEFRGPLLPEPITGEAAVREHLRQLAPFVNLKLVDLIVENDTAAAMMDMETINGVKMQGAGFFRVRDGAICFDQGFSDTHRLFKGGS
jgi:hypothetical protein